jgi:lipopolysaccharide/colanic/teichoic acid biosynthesis glycosyltransferase
MLKRSVDVLLSALGLLLMLPVLLVIALLVKLDSRGPVLFRQTRVGLGGRPFRILKFRTMVDGAYRMGSRLTAKRDPRVTRVGRVLRRLKLDELPQLLNVLRGHMSLIGPRPEDPYFVGLYSSEQRRVLSVRPGIVGPSQIFGRNEADSYPEGLQDTEAYYVHHILPGKLKRDLEYVDSASFWGDAVLLMQGVWATLAGSFGARLAAPAQVTRTYGGSSPPRE